MRPFALFPLMLVVVVVYNVTVTMAGANLDSTFIQAATASGAPFTLTKGQALLAFGLILLYGELFKATRTSQASIIDHALSMGVFVLALVEFLVVKSCGTGYFFLILLMCALDVVAGFTVTISGARRDYTPGHM